MSYLLVGVLALGTVFDQSSGDVASLQAWLGPTITGSAESPSLGGDRFDEGACVGGDCTAAAAALLALPGHAPSPFVKPLHFTPQRSGRCEIVELRTVTRLSAVEAESFAGLGFWIDGIETFVPAAQLDEVGRTTLRDGSPAVVHRFLAAGMCFGLGGNTGSILQRRYDWKPYARFDVPGAQYRNWDVTPMNSHLGRASDGNFDSSFDREGELLH
jgi:hypothetical protein